MLNGFSKGHAARDQSHLHGGDWHMDEKITQQLFGQLVPQVPRLDAARLVRRSAPQVSAGKTQFLS